MDDLTQPAAASGSTEEAENFPNYISAVLAIFDSDEEIEYKHFEKIPEKLFPCVYHTEHKDYKTFHTVIVKAEYGNIQKLKGYFLEIAENVYAYKHKKHKANANFKWLNCGEWDKPKRAYRVLLGQCAHDGELVQIFFTKAEDYDAFRKDFYSMYLLKNK